MEPPDLTGQPWWAYAIFIACSGIAYAVLQSGILKGRSKPPSQDAGEVVALSIDTRALDRVSGELAGLAIGIAESTAVGKKLLVMAEDYINEQKRDRADQDVEEEVRRRVAEEREAEKSSREMEAEVARRVTAELERQQTAAQKRPSRP